MAEIKRLIFSNEATPLVTNCGREPFRVTDSAARDVEANVGFIVKTTESPVLILYCPTLARLQMAVQAV